VDIHNEMLVLMLDEGLPGEKGDPHGLNAWIDQSLALSDLL
jgi:hypothetical protein